MERGKRKDDLKTEDCTTVQPISGPQWYKDPLFSRYWKHYNLAMSWYGYHCQLATRTLQTQYSTHPWQSQPRPFSNSGDYAQQSDSESQDTTTGSFQSRLSKRNKRKRDVRRKNAKLKKRAAAEASDNADQEVDEDALVFEMEITPEMREFFATSAKHRRERDAQLKDSSENADYIDLTEVTLHTKRLTVAPPTERPGMRRTEQMKLLYGSGAAMIHGMETSLQLNFDRNFDIKTPKLWPHLPLNITFHS